MKEDKDEISNQEFKNIEKILDESKNKKVHLQKKHKNISLSEKQKLASVVANKLSEHIDSYILVGFDVNGNDLVVVNCANNLENRALKNLMEDFLMPYNDQDDFDEPDF